MARSHSAWMGVLLLGLACAGSQPSNPAPAPTPPNSRSITELRQVALDALGAPPPGYAWVIYRNAAILKPDGWNEHRIPEQDSGKQVVIGAWATSPETFSSVDPFEMGYTVQIISHPKARHGLDAGAAANQYLKPFIETHHQAEQVLMFDQQKKPDGVELIWFRYRDAPPNMTPVIVHKYLVVNPRADSVHAFTFESPEATWKENWERFGTTILKSPAIITILPSDDI